MTENERPEGDLDDEPRPRVRPHVRVVAVLLVTLMLLPILFFVASLARQSLASGGEWRSVRQTQAAARVGTTLGEALLATEEAATRPSGFIATCLDGDTPGNLASRLSLAPACYRVQGEDVDRDTWRARVTGLTGACQHTEVGLSYRDYRSDACDFGWDYTFTLTADDLGHIVAVSGVKDLSAR